MFGFGGVNTAPSGGFMSRLMGGLHNMRQNIPGAINALGGAMPGPMGDTSRIAGGLMKNRPGMRPNMGAPAPGGMPSYGGGMPGDQGPQQGGGMVRMPDFAYHPMFGGIFGRGGGGNTGIAGNMYGGGTPQLQMSGDNGNMPMGNSMGGSGLWGAYNNLSNEQGAPTGRQMFY